MVKKLPLPKRKVINKKLNISIPDAHCEGENMIDEAYNIVL